MSTFGVTPRVREMFEQAVGIAPDASEAMLRDLHADANERAVLDRLLRADRRDSEVFQTRAADWAKALEERAGDIDTMLGQHAGPYRLVQLLGRGGSAIVFRAVRRIGDREQTVALKLLHHGMYSPDSRRRFRREQAILAQLSHANIARLVDAGVTDAGAPYIAMEEVHGVDLIAHAAAHALDNDSRLRLLESVCRAVEAAHRAFIVHRDLKPSNVLVTADGQVKVLDFGIAKLLDDDEAATATQHVALTPGYAAPEQYARGAITAATDVYALGVLACELLLGIRLGPDLEWPELPGAKRAAAARRWRALDGELADMLYAMLASDPERRYRSAGHLADDIGRFLRREPLAIRPMSRGYRLRKFVARHRIGVIAASLVLAALVAGAGMTAWESARVHAQAVRAAAARDLLVSVFESAGADLPRDERPSLQDIIAQAESKLDLQGDLDSDVRTDLLLTLARVARSVGSYDRASQLLDRAEPLIARLYRPDETPRLQALILRASVTKGPARTREILRLLEPLRPTLLARTDRLGAEGLYFLSDAVNGERRTDEALSLIRRAEAIARNLSLPDLLLATHVQESRLLADAERFREASLSADAAVQIWRAQGRPRTPDIVELYGSIALGAEASGDMVRAETSYRDAIALGERIFDKPTRTAAWIEVFFGSYLMTQGRFDEADGHVQRGLEMRRTVLGDADPSTLDAVSVLGKMFYWKGDFAASEHWLTQGIDLCRAHDVQDDICARLLSLRARTRAQNDRIADAGRDIDAALEQERRFSSESEPAYAWILDNLVYVQIARHDYAAALQTADRVLSIRGNAGAGLAQADCLTRFNRARALLPLGRGDEALAEMRRIEPRYAQLFPTTRVRADMLAFTAHLLAGRGDAPAAKERAQVALALLADAKAVEPGVAGELRRLAADRADVRLTVARPR